MKRSEEAGKERRLRIFGPDYLQADQVIQLFVTNRLFSRSHDVNSKGSYVRGSEFKRKQAFNNTIILRFIVKYLLVQSRAWSRGD